MAEVGEVCKGEFAWVGGVADGVEDEVGVDDVAGVVLVWCMPTPHVLVAEREASTH